LHHPLPKPKRKWEHNGRKMSYLWPYLCHSFIVLGIFGCMYERFMSVCTQWWYLLT
jgi:hypothetical protein